MQQKTQTEVATKNFELWSKKDYDASATYLDENLSFKGPIDPFNNASDYIKVTHRLAQIIDEVRLKRHFADGNDSVFICDLVTNTPAGTVPCAEWIHTNQGKVKAIQVFFDARPFAAMSTNKP